MARCFERVLQTGSEIMTRKRVLLCSLLFSLLYVIPIAVFNKGLNGADLSFHLNRLLGMEGIYASPINFKAFYGIGLGVNYFYPFLTYYPFFVLYRLSHSVFLGYYIYQYLLTIITFLIAYYSISNILVVEIRELKRILQVYCLLPCILFPCID